MRKFGSQATAARLLTCLLALTLAACSSEDGAGSNGGGSDAAAVQDATGAGDGTGGGNDGAVADAASTDTAGADTGATDAGGGDGAATDSGGTDATEDAVADVSADVAPDPCTKGAQAIEKTVVLPLGETLFFDGDDYLAFWGAAAPCPVSLAEHPTGAKATIQNSQRLTPDKAGLWKLQVGAYVVSVDVKADYWNADTFQNYNYAPTQPLALDPDGAQDGSTAAFWVATTTSASVQKISLVAKDAPVGVQATAGPMIHVGSWPTAVAVWPGTKWLLVTQTGRDTLGFLDREAGVLVDAIRLGNEPHNLVVDGSGDTAKAWVVLAGEDRVIRVDLGSRTIEASVDVGHEPRALVLDAKARRLFVGSLISGNNTPLGPLQGDEKVPELWQRDVVVIDVDNATKLAALPEVGTINRGMFLEPGGESLLVATTRADNTKLQVDANTRPHAHHLARVSVPMLLQGKGEQAITLDVDLDKQKTSSGAAASPYTMAHTPDGSYLVATLSASRALLFLSTQGLAEIGRVQTGHDPRGLVFSHGRAWTYAWLSDQVEGIELPATATEAEGKWVFPAQPGDNVVIPVGKDPTPPDVREGQRIFNDAAFSKFGDFSCNNCHVDGLTDGLVWDLLVDGPVNTLAFRNVGGTEPFLWGGQLPTLFDFSREVLKLVGANATGKQMEQLTRYMQSVTAPPNPHALPGGKLTAEAEHGKAIFYQPIATGGAECGVCHAGALGTSGQVVEGKTKGKQTDVPSLLGVYDTAPYGRQGQWFTLGQMVDYALEFTGAKLSSKDRDAVLAFVQQLPGDLLTLNSARPLAGSDHVWKELQPELIFSNVLAAGQESHFHFVQISEDGKETPVAGSWKLSGRAARFDVSGGTLALESTYRIDVDAGLLSAFGQKLPTAIAVNFTTGGIPAFDLSGKWKMTLQNATVGKISVNVAVLQATGGKFTGVVLDNFDQGNLGADAITGVLSGTTAQLEPFYIDSQYGKFFVKDGFASTMEDSDKDGFADKGSGAFDFKFGNQVFPIVVTWKRTALPKP